MPLMEIPGSRITPDSKSHTRLVISGRTAPAVNFMIDRTLPGLFRYEFSKWANTGTMVVIPKGVLVAVRPELQRDYHTGKWRTAVTYAGPTPLYDGTGALKETLDLRAIGVAPQSYFRRFKVDAEGKLVYDENGRPIPADDLPEGNDFQPSLITDSYIEVPYIPNPFDVYEVAVGDQDFDLSLSQLVTDKKIKGPKFKWGCATNEPQDVGTSSELRPGDFVKAGPFGRFVKWIKGVDSHELIVGQVLEMELDLPPLGWLEWVTPEVDSDELRRPAGMGPIPGAEPAPIEGGYDYDPKYRFPPEERDYLWPDGWKIWNYGIPGLTRGEQITQTWRIKVVTLDGSGNGSVVLDEFLTGKVAKVTAFFDSDGDGTFETELKTGVSYNSGTHTVTITGGPANAKVQIRFQITNLVGTPPYWDYVGSVGAARILLKL